MGVKILQVDAGYASMLSELGARLFTEAYRYSNTTPEDMKAYLESAYTPEIQTQELMDPRIFTYMVFDAMATPVAFCQLRDHPNEYECIGDRHAIELARIYVDERHAGNGVGTALLQRCINKGKQLGKKTIWLSVWDENPSAIAFYKRHGFKKVGIHTFATGSRVDNDDIMVSIL